MHKICNSFHAKFSLPKNRDLFERKTKYANITRWTSTFDATKRLIEIYENLKQREKDLTASERGMLADLKPKLCDYIINKLRKTRRRHENTKRISTIRKTQEEAKRIAQGDTVLKKISRVNPGVAGSKLTPVNEGPFRVKTLNSNGTAVIVDRQGNEETVNLTKIHPTPLFFDDEHETCSKKEGEDVTGQGDVSA